MLHSTSKAMRPKETLDLIRHADRVVEIPNSLCFATAVKPAELEAIPSP